MDAGAVEIIGTVVGTGGIVSVLWAWGNANKNEYVASLLEQIKGLKANALSSETARIAADQAKAVAEKRAGELELKYGYLKQQHRRLVDALDAAQHRVDPGAFVGKIPKLPEPEEPSAVWVVEGDRRASYFLGDRGREDAERRRQQPLNPDAERRERERIDDLSRWYLDSSNPPPGSDSDPPR